LFAPILSRFETGSDLYTYKPLQRTVLIVLGLLFSGLASVVFALAQGKSPGYLFPVVIFGGVGFVSLVIGILGNDRAVAKIWGSGKR